MTELQGKVALVTGGGRGIGRAVVERLAREGADIVVNDLDSEPAQDSVEAAIALGAQAVCLPGNISQRSFGDDFVKLALDTFGSVDIVVNNAGYATYGPAEDTLDDDFDAVLDVLVSAPFRILRAAGRYFREEARKTGPERTPPRKVVNVASIGGLMGAPHQVAYGVGKAGIIGLTNTLAREWAKYNVTVNAVAPGLTRTRLTEGPDIGINTITIDDKVHSLTGGVWPPESRVPLDEMASVVPLGRIGTPDDIAGAIYFLCTSLANFVTGQTIVIDGGMRTGR
jgi:3-oxoacyl-[acyl-carrier protein] reductase